MDYNLIVIGAGPGGYEAALKAAKCGLKTMLIDKAEPGGTCLNRGCIPTKALLHSSKLYHEAGEAAEIGINAGSLAYDMAKVYENKNDIVKKLSDGLLFLFKREKIDYVNDFAKILDKNTVSAGGKTYTADNLLIATGSVPALPPIQGIGSANVVTSDEVLANPEDYSSIAIIGGGVIGVEFASFYNYLGKKVYIIEALERVLPPMDKEISQNLAMILKKRGVEIHTSSLVSAISNDNGECVCRFSEKGQEKEIRAQAVIVATGRKAYTEGLFAEGFGVDMNRGLVLVNENFQTNIPNVYAIGDVTGGMMLAHAATAHGEVAVDHMLGKPCHVNLNVIPACVYTSPEIAATGMTADEAKAAGIAVKTGKYIMTANGKSMIEREERGFIKLVFDAESGKIIGGSLMCGRASDLIAQITFAVANGLTAEEFKRTILPHPTFCEGINEAIKEIK